MNVDSDSEKYYRYLRQRSLLGRLYRTLLLYPRLNACLNGKVLDFGCGIGDFLKFRPDTIGVDINSFNVDYCKSQGLNAERLGSKGEIPFKDRAFARIVMDNVLEHILAEDVDTVLQEVLRVLSPNGQLLIGVPGSKGFDSDDDHKCFYAEQSLIDLLAKCGCRKVKSFHMPIRIPWLEKYLSQYCIYVLFVYQLSR